jgi:hypothetical protein
MSTIWQGQLNDRSEDYEYHNLGARLVEHLELKDDVIEDVVSLLDV